MGRRYRWRHLIYPRHLIVHHATQQRKLTPDTRLGNSSCTFSPSDPHFSNPSYQYHTGEIIANSSVEYNYSSNDQYHTTNSRGGCASLTSSSKNLNNCINHPLCHISHPWHQMPKHTTTVHFYFILLFLIVSNLCTSSLHILCLLRSFVNFVTQGYKGTVGSSREFRHLMTKEV